MKAYKTEIKPNKKQIELINQTFGNTRYVYNQFVKLNLNRLGENQNIVSGYDFSKMINNDPERPDWLARSPSKAIKQAIMNADKAFRDYLKSNRGKPKLKKKTRDNSFYLIGTIKVERHRIFLPKLKWVRLKEFGYIPNNVKSATVSMKNGRYYVSCLVYETKDERIATSNQGIGIDFGLKINSLQRMKKLNPLISQIKLKNLKRS